jgi:hypothetical protein
VCGQQAAQPRGDHPQQREDEHEPGDERGRGEQEPPPPMARARACSTPAPSSIVRYTGTIGSTHGLASVASPAAKTAKSPMDMEVGAS